MNILSDAGAPLAYIVAEFQLIRSAENLFEIWSQTLPLPRGSSSTNGTRRPALSRSRIAASRNRSRTHDDKDIPDTAAAWAIPAFSAGVSRICRISAFCCSLGFMNHIVMQIAARLQHFQLRVLRNAVQSPVAPLPSGR